jgi:hypothetical protein
MSGKLGSASQLESISRNPSIAVTIGPAGLFLLGRTVEISFVLPLNNNFRRNGSSSNPVILRLWLLPLPPYIATLIYREKAGSRRRAWGFVGTAIAGKGMAGHAPATLYQWDLGSTGSGERRQADFDRPWPTQISSHHGVMHRDGQVDKP